ncbi:hypothetical protein EDB81DRAFT_483160 [Dactylonectria macrodidyma]|uniref:BZIP domain-containing protein n=1 Tax=Dactylonectria macrodidyma TaxID=307937 RepID=A0A9P9EVE0_9HYPO|nr:hypothetical protein EDB81DRAFT_483160 [Dactylonectria macrodidyma]
MLKPPNPLHLLLGNKSFGGAPETPGGTKLPSLLPARPNTRGKGKKNPPATNGRRKAEEVPAKAPPNKKSKYDENGTKAKMTDEEKRTNFLERNRAAATKCRQRKKKWLANLHTKVEVFSTENDALTSQINQLREEMVNLKTLLLAHKDCPVTQPQGLHSAFMSQVVEPFNPQMNPYDMGAPMPNQPAMAGQGVQRRFSENKLQSADGQDELVSLDGKMTSMDDPFFPQ